MKRINFYRKFILFFNISILFWLSFIQLQNYSYTSQFMNNSLYFDKLHENNQTKTIKQTIKALEQEKDILKENIKKDIKEEKIKNNNQIQTNKDQIWQIHTNDKTALGIIFYSFKITNNNDNKNEKTPSINNSEQKIYFALTPKNIIQPNNIIKLSNPQGEEWGTIQNQVLTQYNIFTPLLKDFDIITFKSHKQYIITPLQRQNKYHQGQPIHSFSTTIPQAIAFQQSHISEDIEVNNELDEIFIAISSRCNSNNKQTMFWTEKGNLIGFLITPEIKKEKGIKYIKVIPSINFNKPIINDGPPIIKLINAIINPNNINNIVDKDTETKTKTKEKEPPNNQILKDLNLITLFINTGYNLGTGIIVYKEQINNHTTYYALTNRHVIESFYHTSNHQKQITIKNNQGLNKQAKLYAFINNNREYDDIAIITFTIPNSDTTKKLDEVLAKYINFDKDIQIPIHQGEQVWVLGCQKGLQTNQFQKPTKLKWKQWYFDLMPHQRPQFRQNLFKTGVIAFLNEKEINSDMTLDSGNSGGPLFNAEGKLIGINRSYHKILRISQSININYIKQQFYTLLKSKKENIANNNPNNIAFQTTNTNTNHIANELNVLQNEKLNEQKPYIQTNIFLEDLHTYIKEQPEQKIIFQNKDNQETLLTINCHGLETIQLVNFDTHKYKQLEISLSNTNQFSISLQIQMFDYNNKKSYEETIQIPKIDIDKMFLSFTKQTFSYNNILESQKKILETNIKLAKTTFQSPTKPNTFYNLFDNKEQIIKEDMLKTIVLCQDYYNSQNINLGVIIDKKTVNNSDNTFIYTVILQKNRTKLDTSYLLDAFQNICNENVKITIQTPFGLQDEKGKYKTIATHNNPFSYITFESRTNYPVCTFAPDKKLLLGEKIYLISNHNNISDKALAPHIFQSHLALLDNPNSQAITIDSTFLENYFNLEESLYYNNWFAFDSQGNLINICSQQDIYHLHKSQFPFITFPKNNIFSNKILNITNAKIAIFLIWTFICIIVFVIIDIKSFKDKYSIVYKLQYFLSF
ncbi:trypsin-like serine proteases ['Chrysanthemum coronarium' phytoplasma]|uniref:Trypsin-like serine proteases n=2 Tax='Chrysanthemum coronarium' phytoplasma TaxID=1520703 RepID=A0ABQ0J1Y4_9MOLU|nr:trypsin-like serine proteases ['Chrysanthemum coronarium' phytoplasma]